METLIQSVKTEEKDEKVKRVFSSDVVDKPHECPPQKVVHIT